MKKVFARPEMEIKTFAEEDVIKASGFSGTESGDVSSDTYDIKEIRWADLVG